MPTIILQGKPAQVSDHFFKLPPHEQSAIAREIAASRHSWSELPENIGPSARNTVTGLWDMVTHPEQTAETVVNAAQGGVDRIMPEGFTNFMDTYISPRTPETRERQREISGAAGQALKDRYWGLDNLKNTIITDPVGSALDVGGIAAGAPGLARGLVGKTTRVMNGVTRIGQADDVAGAGELLQAKPITGLFNPQPKPQRRFAEDYPNGVRVNSDGDITKDIEGRPLRAPFVAGRGRVEGPEGLSPILIQRVGEYAMQNPVDKVPSSRLGQGILGRTGFFLGYPWSIEVLDSLPKEQMERVTAHEVGHAIDALANQIPTKGIEKELNFNYSALITGEERNHDLAKPRDYGYRTKHLSDREKIAEAIRAYMVDPNYLKTVAPKTAARIREYVYKSKELSKIIQFNSLAAGGALALALGAASQSDKANANEVLSPDGTSARKFGRLVKALVARQGSPKPLYGPR
jgi:hypothetical protein